MKARIIHIGNSRGIILGKALMERYKFSEEVELNLEQEHIEIRPVKQARQGWDKFFMEMAERKEDELLIDETLNDDLLEEWR